MEVGGDRQGLLAGMGCCAGALGGLRGCGLTRDPVAHVVCDQESLQLLLTKPGPRELPFPLRPVPGRGPNLLWGSSCPAVLAGACSLTECSLHTQHQPQVIHAGRLSAIIPCYKPGSELVEGTKQLVPGHTAGR